MSDQAEGLRVLAKAGAFESVGLPAVFHKPSPNFPKLWTDLKQDLDRWKSVGGFDKPSLPTETLAEFWEMMQRREEQA